MKNYFHAYVCAEGVVMGGDIFRESDFAIFNFVLF